MSAATRVATAGGQSVSPSAALTVAIPFFRRLDYLREALESVVRQTRSDWLLEVADDSGEGAARALVEEFATRDPRIRYHENPHNLGMVANWNACVDRATTPLVSLLHADDRLAPDYAATMAALAEREPDAVAYFCDAEIIDASGAPRFSLADWVKRRFVPRESGDLVLAGEVALHTIMAGNFIMCPTLCFRRSRLGERRFETRWHQVQDLDLTSRLLLEDERLAGVRGAHYHYRRHAENATELQSESLLRFEEEFALFARVGASAAARGWDTAARTASAARMVKFHLAYRAARDLATLRLGAAARKTRFLWRHRGRARGYSGAAGRGSSSR